MKFRAQHKTELRSALIAAVVAIVVAAPLSNAAHEQASVVIKKVTGKRGKRGKRGPVGPVGPQGIPGPQGVAGAAGVGLHSRAVAVEASQPIGAGETKTIAQICYEPSRVVLAGAFSVTGDAQVITFEPIVTDTKIRGYTITAEAETGGSATVKTYCSY